MTNEDTVLNAEERNARESEAAMRAWFVSQWGQSFDPLKNGHAAIEVGWVNGWDAARVAPPAGVEGWQLVPKEPTEAMLNAYADLECFVTMEAAAEGAWKAMLAASPAAPPQVEQQTAGADGMRNSERIALTSSVNRLIGYVEGMVGGALMQVSGDLRGKLSEAFEQFHTMADALQEQVAAPSPRAEEAAPTGAGDDTKRLDFWIAHGAMWLWPRIFDRRQYYAMRWTNEDMKPDERVIWHSDPRAAIDAAIASDAGLAPITTPRAEGESDHG